MQVIKRTIQTEIHFVPQIVSFNRSQYCQYFKKETKLHFIYLSSIYLFGLPRPGLTLRQISTYLGNQGAGDSTKILPQGNLFYQYKLTERQAMVNIILHRKLKIGQEEPF
jgi:hypothetical protein